MEPPYRRRDRDMMTKDELVPLAERVAKHIRVRPSYYSFEDVSQDAMVFLLQQNYDPACGVPEIAWRFRQCATALRDYLKHKCQYTAEFDEGRDGVRDDEPADHKLDTRAALDAVGLTDHERAVLLARYEEGMTQSDIAARFGHCQQAINQVLTTAQDKLRGHFDESYLRPVPVQPAHQGRRGRTKT